VFAPLLISDERELAARVPALWQTVQPMTLKRLLRRRFATLPADAEQRIDAAAEAQLDTWLDGIFDAASVEDLLGK